MNNMYKTILLLILLISFSCVKENSIKMGNGLIIEDISIGEGQEARF